MPVLPSCLLDPLWDQFAALLPEHVDSHPLGCHNPRIPDRIVFERIAGPGCSDRTTGGASHTGPSWGYPRRSTHWRCRRTTA